MRVIVIAFALCTLSFLAGVAGDLSLAAQTPPDRSFALAHLPPDAVRAHPLAPLRTAAAEARPVMRAGAAHAMTAALPEPPVKARAVIVKAAPKAEPNPARKLVRVKRVS